MNILNLIPRFAPHLKVLTYGSGGKEVREDKREEITSHVKTQSGGWAKATFPFHVMLCHYEVSRCCSCNEYTVHGTSHYF